VGNATASTTSGTTINDAEFVPDTQADNRSIQAQTVNYSFKVTPTNHESNFTIAGYSKDAPDSFSICYASDVPGLD
jgi:hypothetical protein